MNLQLVSLISTDHLELPGIFYSPKATSKKAAIWLHGMGDNGVFYKPTRINALGKALTDKGIALLAFNNRGAHNRKKLKLADETLPEEDRSYLGGTHYEKILDCIHDIDGAVHFLQEHGFSELYLIGHSTGANKICVYEAHRKHNPFKKYVLAGPGDDVGLFYSELGAKKFQKALAYAQQKLAENNPYHIMPRYTGMYPFSVQATFDILNPDGAYNTFPFYELTTSRLGNKQLFKEYKSINKPLMVIYGEEDEFTYVGEGTAASLLKFRELTNPKIRPHCKYEIVAGADHGFNGYESAFAHKVANWL